MTTDPNNLEGPPLTREERAAAARELDAVAPTPGDKFQLMFNATPRTTSARRKNNLDPGLPRYVVDVEVSEEIERELNREKARAESNGILLREMTEHADKLAKGLPCLPKDVENLREANAALASRVFELESELGVACDQRDDLARWKAEALAVEEAWNPQAVGELLGLALGSDIRAAIEPGIRRLIEQCGTSPDKVSQDDSERLSFLEEHWRVLSLRYIFHPSMDGRYPCWSIWTPKEGTIQRKTLREAIDAAMEVSV